jgi:hypothetical protein
MGGILMEGIGMFEFIVAITSFVILFIVIIETLIKCDDLHTGATREVDLDDQEAHQKVR